jgi:segregation and condensation protein B
MEGIKDLVEKDEKNEKSEKKDKAEAIEALLFIAGRWLSEAEIVRIALIDPLSLREKIEELKKKYDGAIVLREMEKDGMAHYKMDVKDEYKHFASLLAIKKTEFTKAEQETLALIAYKQPIKQSVIIKIRGNKAYDHIKKFIAHGLINAKKSGHTYLLSLTNKFYEYFDVKKK